MNYNKKLIIILWIIACAHAPIQSFLKKTTLQRRVNPLKPIIKGQFNSSQATPIIQKIHDSATNLSVSMENMYETPLYKFFLEPQYIGHKIGTWVKQTKEMGNYLIMDPHDKFLVKTYLKWKNTLSDEQLEQHKDAMFAYNKSYFAYKRNPKSSETLQELQKQTQRMKEIMHRTTPTKRERARRMLFDHSK